MQTIQQPSPNFDSRDGQIVDMLVLHYTGMKSAEVALDRLCNASAKVSAHYLVEEDGTVYQLVDENNRAWHAGVSYWRSNTNINQRSIGIEIVNKGHEFGYTPFPKVQMEAVAELCKWIFTRYAIPARNVVGHSDVAPARKKDPGELFDWKFLADKGIGLFPSPATNNPVQSSAFTGQAEQPETLLKEYGYDTTDLTAAMIAFQRHFRPDNISGIWDDESANTLAALLAIV